MGYRVAVVGATGNVGREILNVLAERRFPFDEVAAVASAASTGDEIDFGDSGEDAEGQESRSFRLCRMGHCAVRGGIGGVKYSRQRWRLPAAPSSTTARFYRMDPDVPLIVPEVNPEAIAGYARRTSSPTPIARPPSWSWR